MLGIIIGIGSVIAIVSIGDTMRSVIAKEYENVGINRVIFYTMAADGVYTNDDMFTQDDVDQVKDAFGDRVPYIDTYCQDRKTLSNGSGAAHGAALRPYDRPGRRGGQAA